MRSKFAAALLALALSASGPAAHAGALKDDLDGLDRAQRKEAVEFGFDNALFYLFHEMGHMMISEFSLPILGREEDAADTLSTLVLLDMDSPVYDKALKDSVEGWTLSADDGEDPDLWDEHSLDKQRAYAIVCMMVGKDAAKFKDVADRLEMPDERRESCADAFRKAHDSWFGLLNQHLRKQGTPPNFTISYDPPKDRKLKDYAALVKREDLLGIVGKVVGTYDVKDDIKLTAAQCDEANAYWSADDRELTYCYELSQWFTQAKAATHQEEDEDSDDASE